MYATDAFGRTDGALDDDDDDDGGGGGGDDDGGGVGDGYEEDGDAGGYVSGTASYNSATSVAAARCNGCDV